MAVFGPPCGTLKCRHVFQNVATSRWAYGSCSSVHGSIGECKRLKWAYGSGRGKIGGRKGVVVDASSSKRRQKNRGESPKNKTTTQKRTSNKEYLTMPLLIETTEILAVDESAPAPIWGSFCGAIQGLWVGNVGAFQPSTGAPEPLALGEDSKTELYTMSQCVVEERMILEDKDKVQRHIARAPSREVLHKEMAAAGKLQFDSTESIDWDQDALSHDQLGEGLYIFDGGSFSMGPSNLISNIINSTSVKNSTTENDDSDDEKVNTNETDREVLGEKHVPGDVNVIEACLQASGEQRIRVQITLEASIEQSSMLEDDLKYNDNGNQNGNGKVDKCENKIDQSHPDSGENGRESMGEDFYFGNFEVDIDLLRVTVHSEDWEGMPGRFVETEQPEETRKMQEALSCQRLQPHDISGFWNCFEVEACTIEDIDTRTGKLARLPV